MHRQNHSTALSSALSLVLAAAACSGDIGSAPDETLDQVAVDETAEAPDYDLVYDTTRVHRYDIELSDASMDTLLADPLSDEYVEGTFRFGDETWAQVGVRFKGNSSRWSIAQSGGTRYSYKVKFNELVDGQTFHGVKTLNLHNVFNDYSFMRERLSYDLLRGAGVPASRVAYVDLWVNGDHLGLYVSVEQVDKNFLESWFGDDDGNLYKPEQGDLVYKGDTIEAYGGSEAYELKTNEAEADYSGLLNFIDVLNNTPDLDLPAALEEVLDVEGFLRWLALNTLLVSLDSYAGSFPHNYYLYDNPATGRFSLIPWDYNEAFGHFTCRMTTTQLLRLDIDAPYCQSGMGGPGGATVGQRPLITRVLAQAEYRERYHELLREYATGAFALTPMTAAMSTWQDLISAYVAADPTKRGTFADFEASISFGANAMVSMPAFVEGRNAYVLAALDGTVEVICGDGICDSGETCEADCTVNTTCPPCAVFSEAAGRCLPSCADTCTCPTDAPMPLVCDPVAQLCVPQAPACNCNADQVCAPNGNCVPRCTSNATCPTQAPTCEVATGLCHP